MDGSPRSLSPVDPKLPRGRDREGKRSAWFKTRIGPYSRQGALARLDKRSREARFLYKKRHELIAHCGGEPSAVQSVLIERACWLSLKVAMLDARLAADSLTDHDTAYYIAWVRSLVRTLRELGIEASPAVPGAALNAHTARLAAMSPGAES
jgi:hypothetical protein